MQINLPVQSVVEAIGSSLLLLLAFSNKIGQVDVEGELVSVVDLDHSIALNVVLKTLQLEVKNIGQRLKNDSLPCVLKDSNANITCEKFVEIRGPDLVKKSSLNVIPEVHDPPPDTCSLHPRSRHQYSSQRNPAMFDSP